MRSFNSGSDQKHFVDRMTGKVISSNQRLDFGLFHDQGGIDGDELRADKSPHSQAGTDRRSGRNGRSRPSRRE